MVKSGNEIQISLLQIAIDNKILRFWNTAGGLDIKSDNNILQDIKENIVLMIASDKIS